MAEVKNARDAKRLEAEKSIHKKWDELRMHNNLTGDAVGREERKRGMVAGARTRGLFLAWASSNWSRTVNLCNFWREGPTLTKMKAVATGNAFASHSYDVNVPSIILSRRLQHGCPVAARADTNGRT